MSKPWLQCSIVAGIAVIAGLNLGCNARPPGGPSPIMRVASIAPYTGPITGGQRVTVTGTGFQTGATLTIGGTVIDVTLTGTLPFQAPRRRTPRARRRDRDES